MDKRITLVLSLMLCVMLLTGCSGSNDNSGVRYDVAGGGTGSAAATQNLFGDASSVVTVQVTQPPIVEVYQAPEEVVTPVPTMSSEYAGATPVVIDPIDKPTPTPLPALSFNYETYDATRIHLSFNGPAGWTIDDSASDSYTITNPSTNADYQASLTISVYNVSSNYTKTELKNEVTTRLSSMKGSFYSFSSTKTAERTLLDKDGVYADYTATLSSGVQIKGRYHITCANKVLYVMHMVCPAGYFETYKDTVYAQFRHTVKITQ